VPEADEVHAAKAPLFDHFVGERKNPRGHFGNPSFGCLEVEHELDLSGLQYR
jgi:hypothetical protein